MKEGWEKLQFEKCLEKVKYTNKIQRKNFKNEGAYPIVSQEKELINGFWDEEDDLFIVDKPMVIFGDHTKIVKFIDFDFVLGADGVKILRTKDIIFPKYLYYFLQSVDLGDLGYARHYRLLKEIEVSYPKSLPEQKRIVSLLDEAFEKIEALENNARQNLENAKELFESYLQNIFENRDNKWEIRSLGELGIITSSKRIFKKEYVKAGIPFYRTKEIKELSEGKQISKELYISKERYDEIKKAHGVPKVGDLLLSAVGTIGEILVISNNDEFYFKDGNIVWLKDFYSLDTNYLKYALLAFVEKIKSLAIGAAYSALTIEKLKKYKIVFPESKEEQRTIVISLDNLKKEIQKLESLYQQKLEDLEELKKSILEKAFKGELTTVESTSA